MTCKHLFFFLLLSLLFTACSNHSVKELEHHFDKPKIFEKKLEQVENINAVDKYGESILFKAVRQDNIEIVKILLKHGANPAQQSLYLGSPIERALRDNQMDIISLFWKDCQPAFRKSLNEYLIEALINDIHLPAFGYLLQNCISVNDTIYSRSILSFALEKGHECRKIIDTILYFQPNVNFRDGYGNNALYYLKYDPENRIARRLIEMGAELNVRNEDGETPFYTAIKQEYLGNARFFLEHGANIEHHLMIHRSKTETEYYKKKERVYNPGSKHISTSWYTRETTDSRLVEKNTHIPLIDLAKEKDSALYQLLLQKKYQQYY
ncbi:MAG: hypothetical protein EP338_05490 [Bacteroidetes bacterium]|nr:MAG: hypothetical protein EP338_05490 [Bacteroidota bacterium]